jgi:hypothetical protein
VNLMVYRKKADTISPVFSAKFAIALAKINYVSQL